MFCKSAYVSTYAVVGHWLALSLLVVESSACHIHAVLDATLLEPSNFDMSNAFVILCELFHLSLIVPFQTYHLFP